jgi:hypothetical protein
MLRVPFQQRVISDLRSTTAGVSGRARVLTAALAIGLLAALVLASQLRADPRGLGTHEQLGLPSCTFLTLTGKRCPACGMTTAWVHVMHGRMGDALRANAMGTLLAVLAMPAALAALAFAVRGQPLTTRPSEWIVALAAVGLTVLIVLEWCVRLLAGG